MFHYKNCYVIYSTLNTCWEAFDHGYLIGFYSSRGTAKQGITKYIKRCNKM